MLDIEKDFSITIEVTMIYLFTLIAVIISATLYRMGGCGPEDLEKEYGWVPAPIRKFPKKRDVGCGVVSIALTWFVIFPKLGAASPWWIHLLVFGALWGALSTYHDEMFYNWMKPDDNFWLHGFICGLPFMFYGIHNHNLLLWLGIRALVMGVFMGIWCHVIFSDAWWEENGRGAIIPASLLILLFSLL